MPGAASTTLEVQSLAAKCLENELAAFREQEEQQQQTRPVAQAGGTYRYPHLCVKKTDAGKSSLLLTYHAQLAEGQHFSFSTADGLYRSVQPLPRVVIPKDDCGLGKGSTYLSMVVVRREDGGAESEILYVHQVLEFQSAHAMNDDVKRAYWALKKRESRQRKKTAAAAAAAAQHQQVSCAPTPAAALPPPPAISGITPPTSVQSPGTDFQLSQTAEYASASSCGKACDRQDKQQPTTAGLAPCASPSGHTTDRGSDSLAGAMTRHGHAGKRQGLNPPLTASSIGEQDRLSKRGRVTLAGSAASGKLASPAGAQEHCHSGHTSTSDELQDQGHAAAAAAAAFPGSRQDPEQEAAGSAEQLAPMQQHAGGQAAGLGASQDDMQGSTAAGGQAAQGHAGAQGNGQAADGQRDSASADNPRNAKNTTCSEPDAAAGASAGKHVKLCSKKGAARPERSRQVKPQADQAAHGMRQQRTHARVGQATGARTGRDLLLRAATPKSAVNLRPVASSRVSKPVRRHVNQVKKQLPPVRRIAPGAAPGTGGCPPEGQLLTVDEDGIINIRVSMLRCDKVSKGSLGECICSLGIAATCPANSDPALRISAEESAAVGRFGRLCGGGIFDTEKRNAKGDLVYAKEADGVKRLQLDSDNMRKQVPLDSESSLVQEGQAHDPEFADDLVRVYGAQASVQRAAADERTVRQLRQRLEPAAKQLAVHCAQQLTGRSDIDGDSLLKQCVALVNDWYEDCDGVLRSCPQQVPHHDLREADGHVLIWATDSVQLLWWPLTHCAIQAEQTCNKMSERDKKLFFGCILGHYPCVRLWLERDDVVALRGTTGHAGAPGKPGSPAGRFHWYAVLGKVGDQTNTVGASCLDGKVHVAGAQCSTTLKELKDNAGTSCASSSNSNNADLVACARDVLDEEEQAVLMGWCKPIHIADEELWRSDLMAIEAGRWLGGHVMSAAFHLLQKAVDGGCCAFLKADFASLFTDGKGKVKEGSPEFQWPKAEAALRDSSIQRLIMPVQVLTSHWACICVDKQDWTIHCWDSMMTLQGGRQFLEQLAQQLRLWLVENVPVTMLKEQKLNVVHHEDVPQQQNGSDCGLFTIGYAIAAALHKPAKHIGQGQATALRLKLLYAIQTMSAAKLVKYVEQL